MEMLISKKFPKRLLKMKRLMVSTSLTLFQTRVIKKTIELCLLQKRAFLERMLIRKQVLTTKRT